jgi:hypothetical protein
MHVCRWPSTPLPGLGSLLGTWLAKPTTNIMAVMLYCGKKISAIGLFISSRF